MHIECTICRDLFVESDTENIFATSCGHLFHNHCLQQWFERSKSCPQCRQKFQGQKSIKLYFSFPNPESLTQDDPSALQNKIQCLNFQIKLKDIDIKNLKEDFEKTNIQNKGLKDEIKKMREEIRESRSKMYELSEQLRILKQKTKILAERELEIERLSVKLADFESLREILDGPAREVDEQLLRSTLDPNALRMCVSTFKKELAASKKQTLALQEVLSTTEKERNRLNSEIAKYKDEISVLGRVNQKLKELKICHEDDIRDLKKKINDLEKILLSEETKRENTLLQDSSAEMSISLGLEDSVATSQGTSQPSSQVPSIQTKREDMNIFSKSRKIVNLQSVSKRVLDMAHWAEETGKVYNGLGGLARCDDFNFSNRDKFKNLIKKKNLSAVAGSAAKKLKPDPKNLKLDSFFVN